MKEQLNRFFGRTKPTQYHIKLETLWDRLDQYTRKEMFGQFLSLEFHHMWQMSWANLNFLERDRALLAWNLYESMVTGSYVKPLTD